jgi:predicted PurR-regulated permease PerM
MLYLLFFLLRDGDELFRTIKSAIPLRAEQQRAVFSKFATVIRATVKGTIVVAVVQGALGGLIFWFLGIRAALLWAVLMAFLSLLPAVGAALVWLPVAIYLVLTGAIWQGLVLIAYGVCVIGLVDNLLRPILVGSDTKMRLAPRALTRRAYPRQPGTSPQSAVPKLNRSPRRSQCRQASIATLSSRADTRRESPD